LAQLQFKSNVQPELHIWQPKYAETDLSDAELGGVVKHNRSWISLVSYCLIASFGAALVFAIIIAGGSVALASHQSASTQELQEDAAVPQNFAEAQNNSVAQQHSDQQDRAPADPQHPNLSTFSGLVTDSYCGARHRRHSNLTPEDCARACIRNGATYVLVNGRHRYTLSGNEESLNKLLGTRATVNGTLQGETILVNSAGPQL
jgi:hypothetical protein